MPVWEDRGSHPAPLGPSASPSSPAISGVGINSRCMSLHLTRMTLEMSNSRAIMPKSVIIVHGVNGDAARDCCSEMACSLLIESVILLYDRGSSRSIRLNASSDMVSWLTGTSSVVISSVPASLPYLNS